MKRTSQKLLKTTQIAYCFVRFMGGRTIKAVFELFVVLSITWHDLGITFSDVSNFFITRILICKMLLLSSEKLTDLCFTSLVKPLLLSRKCFFVCV